MMHTNHPKESINKPIKCVVIDYKKGGRKAKEQKKVSKNEQFNLL